MVFYYSLNTGARNISNSIDSFQVDTRTFWYKQFFIFWMRPFAFIRHEQLRRLDNLIESNCRIIWHHRLIALKPIVAFKFR